MPANSSKKPQAGNKPTAEPLKNRLVKLGRFTFEEKHGPRVIILFKMNILQSAITNKILIVPFCAWALANVLKFVVASIRFRRPKWSYLVTMGGMPSSHSALVCALATTAAIVEGVGSALFAVTVFFAMIVIYDAAGVRQTVGTQSIMLNKMLDELFKGKVAFEQRFRELIGHSAFEVTAGAALGVIFALVVLLA
jgi:acid phosphatase family membrane protein YuiD